MNSSLLRLLPLLVLLLLSVAMAFGLFSGGSGSTPGYSSKLVGQPVAQLKLPALDGNGYLSPAQWQGQVVVLNVFASWCQPCASEAPALMRLAQSGRVAIYGLAWRDKPAQAVEWLNRHGNPYRQVGVDQYGRTTLALALTGVPETFVINKDGTIVYQYQLPLTDNIVNTIIIPLVDRLNSGNVQ